MMKQLIEDIVKALVDQPDEVQIKEMVGDHAHVLERCVTECEVVGESDGVEECHPIEFRAPKHACGGSNI